MSKLFGCDLSDKKYDIRNPERPNTHNSQNTSLVERAQLNHPDLFTKLKANQNAFASGL